MNAEFWTTLVLSPDFWETLFFVILIPLIYQAIKKYKEKKGKSLTKSTNQIITLVITTAYAIVTGGFASIDKPGLPLWQGDVIQMIGDVLVFLGSWLTIITVAWGTLMASYEGVWDKLFVFAKVATKDKLALPKS